MVTVLNKKLADMKQIKPIALWWVFIRTLVIFFLCHQQGYAQEDTVEKPNTNKERISAENISNEEMQIKHVVHPEPVQPLRLFSVPKSYSDIMLTAPSKDICSIDGTTQSNMPPKRPKCVQGKGCDIPLNCFNYSSLINSDPGLGLTQVVATTPLKLEEIIENPNISNNCVLVMFYAPWCEYSSQFARRFNTVGRMFRELPVLAVDLSDNNPHKYVLAYLPVVAFYHRGKVVYRFKLTETLEELQDFIFKMTDFPPLNVSLYDWESDGPVPVVRVNQETPLLLISVVWIAFVAIVFTVRSRL